MINFDENLEAQFKGLRVKLPDAAKHIDNLYGDYVELVALFSGTDHVTKFDILDRIKDSGESSLDEIIANEFDEEDITTGEIFDDKNTAKRNDLKERWVDNLFDVIEDRSGNFDINYPFIFNAQRGLILKKDLNLKAQLYLFLLISSNLDLFSRVATDLTRDFEEISYSVLKSFLPSAVVKKFGKNSEYSGNAKKKIRALASDMKLRINEESLKNISEKNNQERGLDVAAWVPFIDDCANIFIILGQCACGKDWPRKYHDTQRFSTYMKYFRLKPIHAMFIPYSLISKNSSWFYSSDDIERGTIMFERKRIVDLFLNAADFSLLPSKRIVDKCIEYSEDIV